MSKLIAYSLENCFICCEFMGSFKNELTESTGYSEKTIYQLIENFTNINLSQEIIDEAGICQNCFIKFNEYDEHRSVAEQIQAELSSLFQNTCESYDNNIKQEKQDTWEDQFHAQEEINNSIDTYEASQISNECIAEMYMESAEEGSYPKNEYIISTLWDDDSKRVPFLKEKSSTFEETESKKKNHQCEICFKTFKEKSKLRTHRLIHTTVRNVICPICSKAFKTQACLRAHKRVHNPTYVYCDYCGKSYTQKPELSRHMKFAHFNIRDFSCEFCSATFATKSHLTAHRSTHTGLDYKTIVCEVCDITFLTKAKLDRHMKSHTGERNFECSICDKKFLYSYNVTAHIKHVHYREKRKSVNRECSICSKKFFKVWKLREHLRDEHNVMETDNVI